MTETIKFYSTEWDGGFTEAAKEAQAVVTEYKGEGATVIEIFDDTDGVEWVLDTDDGQVIVAARDEGDPAADARRQASIDTIYARSGKRDRDLDYFGERD